MDALPDLKLFLHTHNLTEEEFTKTGLDWGCLREIHAHHTRSSPDLLRVAHFISGQLQPVPGVHSLKFRVKNPESLVAKIIRKKLERPDDEFSPSTYEGLITDLIGVRAIHLFKNDWRPIHDFIRDGWERHEQPVAYYRKGDPESVLRGFAEAGCMVKPHPHGYRSLHHVVKCQPLKRIHLIEIQVRTIFEEGWSEIDHRVRYPLHSSDQHLAEFIAIFNRLAGSADEMGTFVKALSVRFAEQAVTQAKLKQTEDGLKEMISQLEVSQDEKVALQKKIEEMQILADRSKGFFDFNTLKMSGIAVDRQGVVHLDHPITLADLEGTATVQLDDPITLTAAMKGHTVEIDDPVITLEEGIVKFGKGKED